MTLIDKAEAHDDDDLIRRGDAKAAVLPFVHNVIADDAIAAIAALPARGVGVKPDDMLAEAISLLRNEASRDYAPEKLAMLKLAADICAFINGEHDLRERILAALAPTDAPDLSDPVTVHVNMLRGTIAKPTVEQIIHLYGREAFRPVIDAAVAKALEDACLAVSEHADWPEDEHGRTEQVGLFVRVINAIRAITPALSPAPTDAAQARARFETEVNADLRGKFTDEELRLAADVLRRFRGQMNGPAEAMSLGTPTDAAHVNKTPKNEHDAGNMLTPAHARPRCPYGATGYDCCGGYCDMDDDEPNMLASLFMLLFGLTIWGFAAFGAYTLLLPFFQS